MAVRCPYCSYPNFANAKTCRRCNKEIPDICPSCEAVLHSEADFCPVCGELLERKESQNVSSQTTKKNVVKPKSEMTAYSIPRTRELKECVICFRKIAANATFCPYCGHKFDKLDALSAKAPIELETDDKAHSIIEESSPSATQPEAPSVKSTQVKKPEKSPSKPLPRPAGQSQKEDDRTKGKLPPRPMAKPTTAEAPKRPPKPRPVVQEKAIKGSSDNEEQESTDFIEEETTDVPEAPPESSKAEKVETETTEQSDAETEEAKRLRASHISIKENSHREVKIRQPIEHPIYIEREFSASVPQYPALEPDAAQVSLPEGMVHVPGGPFLYGLSKEKISLPSFFMDIYPVTCEEYYQFCLETKHCLPSDWVDIRFLSGKEKHPVTQVNLNDARAYAAWVKKRLPTEKEWEKAAASEDGLKYPWGNEFLPDISLCRNSTIPKLTVPVDTFPENISAYGCNDMLGNAAEWTENQDIAIKRNANPTLRGGCLKDSCGLITCQTRILIQDSEFESACIGFRCVKDIKTTS